MSSRAAGQPSSVSQMTAGNASGVSVVYSPGAPMSAPATPPAPIVQMHMSVTMEEYMRFGTADTVLRSRGAFSRSSVVSYLQLAASLALVCTAGLEAFGVFSIHPILEIGAGSLAGAGLAAIWRAAHT